MARSPFTLAALATAAVPELVITGVRSYSTEGTDDFDSALVTDRTGTVFIVRVANTETARHEQDGDLVALGALTAGVRSRLPFDIPQYRGQAPVDDGRAVVYTFVHGHHIAAENIPRGEGLTGSLGHAIAAIHSLPTNSVSESGLPHYSAGECRDNSNDIVESAAATGLLPLTLRERWRGAISTENLWQFQPAVINGSLGVESFLVDGDIVTGVLGWSELRVGDPAQDLHWLLALNPDVAEGALSAYSHNRHMSTDQRLTQRANLYAELDVARWLLHGRATRDQSIIDDAVTMLDGLVDRIRTSVTDPIRSTTETTLAVDDVEELLDHTPGAPSEAVGNGLTPVSDTGTLLLDDDDDPDSTPTTDLSFR